MLFRSMSVLTLNKNGGIPLLLFGSLFFVDEEGVLVLQGSNKIIESEVIGFELSELVDFLFEFINENVFLFVLNLGQLVRLDGSLGVVEVLAVHDNGYLIIYD